MLRGSSLCVVMAGAAAVVACSGCGSVPGPFASRAGEIVSDLADGKYAAAVAAFDPTMKTQLPVSALGNNWTTYEQQLGSYRGHDAPSSVMKGQLDVERVPVTMANGTGEVRITFHPDGTIAGLFFLSANAPAP